MSRISQTARASLFIARPARARYSIRGLVSAGTKRRDVARGHCGAADPFCEGSVVNMFAAFVTGPTMWNLVFG
jgi:hypothetical protein